MEIQAAIIGAVLSAQEAHAVLCCAMASAHDIATTAGGWRAIDGVYRTGCILAAVVGGVETNDGGLGAGQVSFDKNDL